MQAGVPASLVSLLFLGTGPYAFQPIQSLYVTPQTQPATVAESTPAPTPAPAPPSTGSNQGLIIGAAVGGAVFVAVLALVICLGVRRRRAQNRKLNGTAVVARWERERAEGERSWSTCPVGCQLLCMHAP